MKTRIIQIVVLALILGACSDEFLERPPADRLTEATYYTTDNEVLMGTAPLYNAVWFSFMDNTMFTLGDGRGGNMRSNDRYGFYQFSVAAGVGELLRAWQSCYNVIGQSNTIMRNIDIYASDEVSEDIINHAIAEARFMRGTAYMYLVMSWGAVPIIYDNLEQITDTSIARNTEESVWEFAIRDVSFAAMHLPEQPRAKGRLSRWSAEGMLAKMYLYRSGLTGEPGVRNQSDLDSAIHYASNVVHYSGLELMPEYYDLFLTKNNNNDESLFAHQWMGLSDAWGVNNTTQAYLAFDPKITGTGDGWGAAHGASADIVQYYIANPNDMRRKATFMFNGDHYPDITAADGGLDYDIGHIANVKKYIVGTPEDNDGVGAMMSTAINTYVLRLAEVYLIYAEAILGNNDSTSDPDALEFFNKVRTRAALPALTSITHDDILQEKRIELAMEGNYWYDLLSLYYWQPEKAKNIINNQDKGDYTIEVMEDSDPLVRIFTFPEEDDNGNPIQRTWEVTDQTMFLPIPETEMARAPNLRQDPVDFDFSLLD